MRNEADRGPRWRRLLALAALLLALAAPARSAEIYRIDGMAVDATGESGVAARDLAISNGQREGLTQLMRRLTSPTAYGQLPDVTSVPIERYVNSFEIAQEKVGPNRYVGVINVSYIASQVQALLSRAGIPYVTRRSDPILVVPVTDAAGSAAAWDETSPWRTAWYQAIENARIVVLALPLADLADIAAAPPGALLAGDRAVLDGLGARYGTTTVIVAIARADDPSLSGRVEVELRRADDWPTPILQTAVETEPGADPSVALAQALAQAVPAIEDDWKRRTAAEASQVTTLSATVPLADLAGWVQIRRDLDGLPEVRWIRVDSITQTRAAITIGYLGDMERLVASAAQIGLSLAEETDGWRLQPADGLAAFPAPLPATSVTP
jgi:hypothetical protein